MICQCGATGILNEVLGKTFYYCRSCKDEIRLNETKEAAEKTFSVDYWPTLDMVFDGDNGDQT